MTIVTVPYYKTAGDGHECPIADMRYGKAIKSIGSLIGKLFLMMLIMPFFPVFADAMTPEIGIVRAEQYSERAGTRERVLPGTLIFAERQAYSPFQNTLHRYPDRPLFLDVSLRGSKDGMTQNQRGFIHDLKILGDCGLDGFGAIAYYGINADNRRILERFAPFDGYSQMIVLSPGSDLANYTSTKTMILDAARSRYTTRINGKIVMWTYGGGRTAPKLVKRMREDKDIPPFLLIGEMPFYDLFKAYGYDDHGRYDPSCTDISQEKISAFREKVAEYLSSVDGVRIWCTNRQWSHLGEYPAKELPTPVYRKYLLPIYKDVLSRKEFKDKLVCAYVRQGYINHFSGTTDGEWGTATLRCKLDEIALLNPDILMCFEWNELNENTHFQPTVAHAKTYSRILNHYRSVFDRTPPKPMKGDDPAIPNLVVSVRQALRLGEPYHLELLYLPDGSAATSVTARVTLRNEKGEAVAVLPEETIGTDRLKAVDYRIPSEKFAGNVCITPELTTVYNGRTEKWSGFDSTRLRSTTCRDYLYTHQPLRELAKPVRVSFDAMAKGDGVYGVQAEFSAAEGLASLEVLDDVEEKIAYDPDNVFDRDRFAVFRVTMTVLQGRRHFGSGAAARLKGVAKVSGAPNAVFENAGYCWECFSVGKRESTGYSVSYLASSDDYGTFFVKVPYAELKGSHLEMDLSRLGKISVPLDEPYALGRKCWPLQKTVSMDVERLDNLADVPRVSGRMELAIDATLRSSRKVPLFQLRAITVSGKIWRSAPIAFGNGKSDLQDISVWSESLYAATTASVASVTIPDLNYRFEPANGSVLRSGWENRFDGFLGGGSPYGGPMWRAEARGMLPKDFNGRAAPHWTKDEGRDVLDFSAGSYLWLPHEAVPRSAQYSLEFEIKPRDVSDQVLIRSYSVDGRECHLRVLLVGGSIHVSYFGANLYTVKDFDTKAKISSGEWNRVKIVKTFDRIVCDVNDVQTSFPCDRRGKVFQQVTFGGNVVPGEKIPVGTGPFRGLLRKLRVRHLVSDVNNPIKRKPSLQCDGGVGGSK